MPPSNRTLRLGAAAAACAITGVYAWLGQARPPAEWRLLDIVGEGGTALLAAGWLWIVLGSRPAGRVTLLLALGLTALALGAWADALDELFSMQAVTPRVDKWLESGLVPLGMLLVTAGLLGWRREQLQLSDHMHQRERLFRDHRAFDRITQLAQVDYLREQILLEQSRQPHRPAALLMVEIEGLAALLHEHGRRDSVRALQAVTHQLLLNLRYQDLLCRHAGDRMVILLPDTGRDAARRIARHLERMVRQTAFHTLDGAPVKLGLRGACSAAEGDARQLLQALGRELDRPAPADAAAAGQPAA
jgi:diguanylate cyclase (GGDEF)-like protein